MAIGTTRNSTRLFARNACASLRYGTRSCQAPFTTRSVVWALRFAAPR